MTPNLISIFWTGGSFGFGGAKTDFAFYGTGAPVFGQGVKKDTSAAAQAHSDDDDQVDEAGKKNKLTIRIPEILITDNEIMDK